MHEAIHTQDKVSMTLIALLEDHRDAIASSWLDAIQHQQPLLHYGKRPTHEIHTNNLVALDMLLMLIQGHEPDLAWVSHADASLASQYVDLGIEVTEMVTASLLLDEVIDPYIQETFSHDLPRMLSLSRALRRHISTFAQEIVKGYVEASSKHLREQQQRTALMLGITRAVSASLDLDRVLHHVVRGVASAADAHTLHSVSGGR